MILIQDVVTLAEFAKKIDELKNLCADMEQRRLLTRAVGDLHRVAVEIDTANGFGIYPQEAA